MHGLCNVFRPGIGGRSFTEYAENTIQWKSTKCRISLRFIWVSTVSSSTVSCRLPSKLTARNNDSTKYDHSGWNESLSSQSTCLTVLTSLVLRMWTLYFCQVLYLSYTSYILLPFLCIPFLAHLSISGRPLISIYFKISVFVGMHHFIFVSIMFVCMCM